MPSDDITADFFPRVLGFGLFKLQLHSQSFRFPCCSFQRQQWAASLQVRSGKAVWPDEVVWSRRIGHHMVASSSEDTNPHQNLHIKNIIDCISESRGWKFCNSDHLPACVLIYSYILSHVSTRKAHICDKMCFRHYIKSVHHISWTLFVELKGLVFLSKECLQSKSL